MQVAGSMLGVHARWNICVKGAVLCQDAYAAQNSNVLTHTNNTSWAAVNQLWTCMRAAIDSVVGLFWQSCTHNLLYHITVSRLWGSANTCVAKQPYWLYLLQSALEQETLVWSSHTRSPYYPIAASAMWPSGNRQRRKQHGWANCQEWKAQAFIPLMAVTFWWSENLNHIEGCCVDV